MRWLPRSLQARMLSLSAIATVCALLLAGGIIAGVLGRFVMAGIDRRLDSQVALLAAAVTSDGDVDRARLRQQATALEDERSWRWQIVTPTAVIGPEDFPQLSDPAPPPAPPQPPAGATTPVQARLHSVEGRDAKSETVHARRLVINTTGGAVTITATAPDDVIRRPILDALTPLLLVLASLGGLLAALTLVQLQVGLRPIRRLRDQVAAIRSGLRSSVDEDQPTELQPLAAELNALARDNAAALATARLSAANLAHALKTPVSALALELRDHPRHAAQLARIGDTIRHHLARARAGGVDHRARTAIAPALGDLIVTIERIHQQRGIVIERETPDLRIVVAMDAHDLDELLGNLLDNAVKNARHRVLIRVEQDTDPKFVGIQICDDGPGIDVPDRTRALAPGVRLDQRGDGDGDGFGLAIASELATLYGGTLSLGDAPDGGLCVSVRVPRAFGG